MNRLEDFLTLTQRELFSKLRRMYKSTAVYSAGNYILVPGEAPIMLLAHLDTVHHERVKQICKTANGTILMSPQGIGGDDRCGVYALVKLHNVAIKKPWLLFTCDEETGGSGATMFCEHYSKHKFPKAVADLKLLVELDRKGEKDAVYYSCENDDFEDYITGKGFKTEWGSFSDISIVAPELGVAAVNLSSGYYNAHMLHEYINRNHLDAVVKKVTGIISDASGENFPKYEYIESKSDNYIDFYGGRYGYGRGYSGRYAEDYGLSKTTVSMASYKSSVGSTKTANEAPELEDVPMDIADYYNELLEIYTTKELDYVRKEYGDNFIKTMYESEIGYHSDDDFEGEDDYTGGGDISVDKDYSK